MLPTWQALGRLDISISAPAAAGSLVRCHMCGGRGRVIDYVQDGPEDYVREENYCRLCQGQGQFALPPERHILLRQARMGEVSAAFEEFLPEDEDDEAARPRRMLRRLTDAA
jgi:hypothetical protein